MRRVIPFPKAKAARTPSAAAQYAFAGDPSAALRRDDDFLWQAAIFQELRDCLAAGERGELPRREAVARAQDLVALYLDPAAGLRSAGSPRAPGGRS
jgi:hypothetical protein